MRARRLERRRAALTLPRTLTLTATLTLTPALSLNLSLTLTLTLTLGALLASGGEDHAVLLWQLSEGRLLRRLRGHDSHRTINRTLKPQPQPLNPNPNPNPTPNPKSNPNPNPNPNPPTRAPTPTPSLARPPGSGLVGQLLGGGRAARLRLGRLLARPVGRRRSSLRRARARPAAGRHRRRAIQRRGRRGRGWCGRGRRAQSCGGALFASMAANQAHACGGGQVHADQPAASCRRLLRPRRGVTRSDAERRRVTWAARGPQDADRTRARARQGGVAVLATPTVAVRV